ncbi:MAG: YceD family protein [Alphaproteobacteria bacterium]
MPHPAAAPEFFRPVRLGQVGRGGHHASIAATPAERTALAARFELASLARLEADVTVEPMGRGDLYRVHGTFRAELEQICVVTGDPVPARFDQPFATTFTTDPQAAEPGTIEVDIEAEDPPEPIEGDAIDVGEAVVQELAVSLDPYPRVDAPAADGDETAADEALLPPTGPFAALARLKKG